MNDTIFIIVIIITLLGFLYAIFLLIQMNMMLYTVREILKKQKIKTSLGTFLLLEDFKELIHNESLSDISKQEYNKLHDNIKRVRKNTRMLAIGLLSIWGLMILIIIIL